MVINIVKTIDCRTPEQKRMSWKTREYKPEKKSLKDMPLPEIQRQMPHMIQKNTPVGVFNPRQIEYGKNK